MLKTGHTGEARKFVPIGMMSNHAWWDSKWFYLRNNEGFFPPYTRCVITARPDHWKYGVLVEHQPWLWPLLDALKRLCNEGLMAAIILSVVHHRRVLPLMARPLRLDKMGQRVAPKDLEACRMSGEALPDKEIVTRVNAAIAGTFRVESVNCIPMMPEEGYLDLVIGSSYSALCHILRDYHTTLLPIFLTSGCFHVG